MVDSLEPFGGHSHSMLSNASLLLPRVEYWYWFSCIWMKVLIASSLAIGRWSMSWGPFLRGFLCAGGVDSGFGEVEDDVEALGSDFVGRGSSELGECTISFGIGSSSSNLTSFDGSGDGRPSSVEKG